MTGTSKEKNPVGNVEARKSILASIRENLRVSKPFDAVHLEHKAGHATKPNSRLLDFVSRTSEDLIDTFCGNLRLVGGVVTVVSNGDEAGKHVVGFIGEIGAKRIAISDSELIGRLVKPIVEAEIVTNASADWLFASDLGITSAQWAIAETGTLVMIADAESHRLTSLVPPVHLCVVRAADIRQTLGEILELASRDLSRLVTFVTGASRTSDIELTLAIGVHGPGELHVIVIADQ
ncbi:hypothetical protein BH10ACI2_BH10ACI2_14380 [soil metagenome]